jgi:phage terminase large subunit-like protein
VILHAGESAGSSPFAGVWEAEREAARLLVDPVRRLMDPAFTERLWYYEFSKIGEEIPGSLHPKQLEALTNRAKHRWLFWGNQVGKTTLGAIDTVLKALGRHPLQLAGVRHMPPWNSWASALTWELWENVLLPELLTWIPPDRIIDAPPPSKQSTKRHILIRADNGKISRITGKAAEQGAARYQSARIDEAWLDEEHPESVWDEMQPRLLRYGGSTLATMTPLLGLTWVHGRVYEPVKTGRTDPTRHWYSHAGLADNPAIEAEAIADLTKELEHNPTQLEARLHGHFTRPHGAVLPWDPEKHLTEERIAPKDFEEGGRLFPLHLRGAWRGAIDLGKWGFAFCFGVADADSQFTVIDEYLSQNEDADTRAKAIDGLLRYWHVPDTILIPADCADPKGIKELNDALDRIDSRYRVYAIDGKLKAKTTGILRVESMLNRGALRVRRGMGEAMKWRQGMSAAKPGRLVMGSRWMWEAANWQYPKTEEGKVQKDEPDDATADGAHMMDANRYLIVSFFPADPLVETRKNPTRAERLKKEMERLDRMDEESEEYEERHRYGSVLRQ